MHQANHADDGHLGATKGGALRGWNQGLCQLGGAEVVSPAEEKGDRNEEYEKEDGNRMRFHGGNWRGGGRSRIAKS